MSLSSGCVSDQQDGSGDVESGCPKMLLERQDLTSFVTWMPIWVAGGRLKSEERELKAGRVRTGVFSAELIAKTSKNHQSRDRVIDSNQFEPPPYLNVWKEM